MTAVQLRGQLGNTNKGYNGNSIDEGVFLFICLIRGSGLRIKPQIFFKKNTMNPFNLLMYKSSCLHTFKMFLQRRALTLFLVVL